MTIKNSFAARVLFIAIILFIAIGVHRKIAERNSPDRTLQAKRICAGAIETSCLRIVDSNGTYRGSLDATEPGRSRLTLVSDSGDARVTLWAIDGNGVQVRLDNDAGPSDRTRSICLTANNSGEVRFDIRRGVHPDFSFFADTNTWGFDAGTAGQGYSQLSLRPTTDGYARLRMFDEDGNIVWQAPEKKTE